MPKKTDSSPSISQHSSASGSLASILPRSKLTNTAKEQAPVEAGKRTHSTRSLSEREPLSKWPGGSWRGKSSAVAGLSQSISAAASTAAETVQSQLPSNIPTSRPFRSLRTPSKSAVAVASTTHLSVTANSQEETAEEELKKESTVAKVSTEAETKATKDDALVMENSQPPPTNDESAVETLRDNEETTGDASKERPMPPAGWLGWWTKPLPTGSDQEGSEDKKDKNEQSPTDELRRKQSQEVAAPQPVITQVTNTTQGGPVTDGPKASESQPILETGINKVQNTAEPTEQQKQQRGSWFGYWGSSISASEISKEIPVDNDNKTADPALPSVALVPNVDANKDKIQQVATSDEAPKELQTSGGWAFWSRERSNSLTKEQGQTASPIIEPPAEASNVVDSSKTNSSDQAGYKQINTNPTKGKTKEIISRSLNDSATVMGKEVGRTENANNNEKKEVRLKPPPKSFAVIESVRSGAAKAIGASNASSAASPDLSASSTTVPISAEVEHRPHTPSDKTGTKTAPNQENLILPAFHDTYSAAAKSGYWQRLMEMLGRGLRPEEKHVSICPKPQRIRKAVIVGVHGLFPAALVQKVLGAPKGTSIRFANGAATALERWTAQQGYKCEVEKIALEGEGLIADRIDVLWKLLLKWADDIREADFVMIACHSQGVPVSIVLMSKLIELGYVNPLTKLGVCAMAGVNLGPFPSYIGKLFGASATELFSFSNPASSVSTTYLSALSLCVRHHVRVAYIASIDDQLVSIESAVFAPISHPYIYRAIFVDGRLHAPDFLTKLVGFAMKLRNLGVSDHGLIRELSAPLAGSLYSGEGHSRVYEEDGVYDVAVRFALESTNLVAAGEVPDLVAKGAYEVPTTANTNPYFLPWAMRGVLEENLVRGPLKAEAEELLRLFEWWRPGSKALKDVRFRLEAVRSRL